jgi:hypothetical protein
LKTNAKESLHYEQQNENVANKTTIMNAFLRICCEGPGVVLIVALIRADGVCNKMQQNKIEVACGGGCHNIGLASNEDGCCCLQTNDERQQNVKDNTFR